VGGALLGANQRRVAAERLAPVLAAAFLTLKPQLALVVLPWYLLRWLRTERGLLLRWAGLCALLHALPLVSLPADLYALAGGPQRSL